MYSFSQVKLFEQCPRKYQYKYIEKIQEKEFESSPDLILGQSVHATLERLYNQLNVFVVPSLEECNKKFHEIRDNEYANATKSKPLQIKGQQTIEDYIRRGEHYIASYYHKYEGSFKNNTVKVIATEQSMTFTLDPEEKIKFRGIIDRLDKEDDCFIINDYKTNKNLPAEDKEDYIQQLTLYAQGVQQKYGKYYKTIKARLHYLHFEITDEREISPELLEKTVNIYRSLIEDIDHKKFAFNMGDKQAFPPIQNSFCKYCEYINICPLWKHRQEEDAILGGELGEKTIKALIDDYVQLSKTITQNEKEKEIIKDLLIDYAKAKDLGKLFGNEASITLSKGQNLSLKDKEKIRTLLTKLGLIDDVLEIDRFKLNTLIKDKKISSDQLGDSIEIKESTSLKTGKL